MSTEQLKFTIPWPPALNKLYRTFKGRVYMTHEGKRYKKEAIESIQEQAQGITYGQDRVEVHLRLYPPDRRNRDIDGGLKLTLDVIEGSGVVENDKQVYRLVVEKSIHPSSRPRVEVVMMRWKPEGETT